MSHVRQEDFNVSRLFQPRQLTLCYFIFLTTTGAIISKYLIIHSWLSVNVFPFKVIARFRSHFYCDARNVDVLDSIIEKECILINF